MPRTKLIGGSGGNKFDDQKTLGDVGKIDEIRVYSGDWINGIKVYYRGGSGEVVMHGGTGGEEHRFKLDSDEYINAIEVGHGRHSDGDFKTGHKVVVNRLRFFTNKNDRSSDVFGLENGNSETNRVERIEFEGDALLTGFYGRSGDSLDAIGFDYDEDPIEYVKLEKVEFLKGTIDNTAAKPELLVKLFATNESDTSQRASVSVKSSASHKVSHSFTKGFKEGITVKYSGKVWEFALNLEATQTISDGEETVVSTEVSANVTAEVPAESEMYGGLELYRDTFDVPYKAEGHAYHKSGKVDVKDVEGRFYGVVAALVKESWEKPVPLTGKRPVDAEHIPVDQLSEKS